MKNVISLVGLVVFLTIASSAYGHGPSLKIDKATAAPGEVITVKGEGITVNGEIKLTLQGILQDYSLGSLQGDAHGRFEKKLTLPSDLEPGSYTLVASGDNTATVKLEVKAGAKPETAHEEEVPSEEVETSHEGAEHARGDEPGVTSEARAEPMQIDRTRTTGEGIFIWGSILLSLTLGVGLLSSRRRTSP